MEMNPDMQALAIRLADRQALQDIEGCPTMREAASPGGPQLAWLNTFALVNHMLLAPEVIAMGVESIRWAKLRCLVEVHPKSLWLVRVRPGARQVPRQLEPKAL